MIRLVFFDDLNLVCYWNIFYDVGGFELSVLVSKILILVELNFCTTLARIGLDGLRQLIELEQIMIKI